MELRERIAEALRGEALVEIMDQQKQTGEPQYVECVEGWTFIVDGTVDFDKLGKWLADAILAIPELRALLMLKEALQRDGAAEAEIGDLKLLIRAKPLNLGPSVSTGKRDPV